MTELIKNILDGRELVELLKRLWDWFQVAGWKSPELWLIAFVTGTSIAYYLFVLAPRKILEGVIGLKETWKKASFRSLTVEERDFFRRRGQFCRALRSDLDTLNKAESWNDQFFTDLEADIEMDAPFYASRLDKLRRRKTHGLRRVPSLMAAIESGTERWQLLVGEPGSGKSVALRHLAHQLAEQGIHSSDLKARVPLYINLKELASSPSQGPDADWIRKFVVDNVRRGDADTAEYVKKNWEHHLREGIWFFLFDSFDEIPEVMHAPMGSSVIERYAKAIRQFLAGMSECRGLIASREFKGPDSLPWHKLRILPLSPERQDELIENTFLSVEDKALVRHHLLANSSSLRHTPQFLSLLCRFVQQQKRPPTSDHDLLWRHIYHLSERDIEYTQSKYGLTSTQLLAGAMELAVLFASNSTLSLASTHDQIAAALPPGDDTEGRLERLLAALVDVKIGRSDVPESRKGDRRFTFSHRRYQETLFVRYLASHPGFLSPRELLVNPRWREYTVALLQSETSDVLAPFLQEATEILSVREQKQVLIPTLPGFGERLYYFGWFDLEIHLLGLLQEGLARRVKEIPPALSVEITQLLSKRWTMGDLYDRTMVLGFGGLLPSALLARYLKFAVENGSLELQDQAFQKIVFLDEPPASLVAWVKERLSSQIMFARGRAELLRLEALCARLPENINAESIQRRCTSLKRWLAPLGALASVLTRIQPQSSALYEHLVPARPRDSVFVAWLGIMLFLLNVLGFTLGLSSFMSAQGVGELVLGWLPELCFFYLGMKYMLRTGSLDSEFDGAGFWASSLLAVFVSIVLMAMISPFVFVFLGIISRSWWLVCFGGVLLVAAVVKLFSTQNAKAVDYRRRQERLALLLSRSCSPEALAPQAQSLAELKVWLGEYKAKLIPDERHARSLSRLVIYGLELESGTMVETPPLIVHCASKKWSAEDVQAVFKHLPRARLMLTPH